VGGGKLKFFLCSFVLFARNCYNLWQQVATLKGRSWARDPLTRLHYILISFWIELLLKFQGDSLRDGETFPDLFFEVLKLWRQSLNYWILWSQSIQARIIDEFQWVRVNFTESHPTRLSNRITPLVLQIRSRELVSSHRKHWITNYFIPCFPRLHVSRVSWNPSFSPSAPSLLLN
jgi:hypothetical protein